MEKKKGGFRTSIGGQALIEGILMRGPEKDAIVVRSPEGLVTKVTERKFVKDKYPILGIPILRGAVTFISSMITGVKALMFSADYFPDDENAEPGKLDKWLDEHIPADKLQSLIVAFSVVLSIGLMLVLFMLPFFIQQNFGIELPSTLEIIILLFIFAAEILGELKCYFITFHHWDTMLHTTTGFLCAATGFALIDILNRNSRIKFQLSPIYVALVAFCFSMTVGVLWEFFEFGMDRLFQMDMQKDTVVNSITSVMLDPTNSNIPVTIDGITSVQVNGQELGFGGYLDIGLYDTMKDLFVNFIGAVVFSTIGYFYIKHRGHGKLAKAFIPTITDKADGAAPPENTN